MTAVPRISVTLPVYNGAKTLRRLLDSIAAQTFTDFRVNMVDNASTDGTAAICREFAGRDERFRYYVNHRNMGVTYSFVRCFHLGADSEFMVYVGHDDYWAPEYLAACLAALEANPKAVVAYSRVNLLDLEGQIAEAGHRDNYDYDLSGPDPAMRYLAMICQTGMLTCHYGLMRARNLADNMRCLNYPSAAGDNILMTSLALEGPFIQLDEALFYRTPPGPRYSQESIADRYQRLMNMAKGTRPGGSGTRPRLSGVPLAMTSFIELNCRILKQHPEVFDYAAQEALTGQTLKKLSQRYQEVLEEELKLLVESIVTGHIHQGPAAVAEDGPEALPRQGQYKFLDHLKAASYLDQLNRYRAYVGDKTPKLHYARAMILLLLGRKGEALDALVTELNYNPTNRFAVELLARLK